MRFASHGGYLPKKKPTSAYYYVPPRNYAEEIMDELQIGDAYRRVKRQGARGNMIAAGAALAAGAWKHRKKAIFLRDTAYKLQSWRLRAQARRAVRDEQRAMGTPVQRNAGRRLFPDNSGIGAPQKVRVRTPRNAFSKNAEGRRVYDAFIGN